MALSSTSVDLTNLLLGLAWLGELDRQQIQRLWFVDKSESTVEKTLARLHREALIARRSWSIHDAKRGVTAPQLARWSLAPAGQGLVKTSDQYPQRPALVRQQRLIAHDARTTETIVRLIEIGRRSKLSGIFVGHELRLSPQERRPVCDALVIMHLGTFDQPNLVPWSSDPAIDDEGRVRIAIEADNDTEPLAVIQAKAYAYRRLYEDDAWATWWTQRYGPLPLPLWVVPTDARAASIQHQWQRAWPDGRWMITTDANLQQNVVQHWRKRALNTMPIAFRLSQPALPAPAAQQPMLATPPASSVPDPASGCDVTPPAGAPPSIPSESVPTNTRASELLSTATPNQSIQTHVQEGHPTNARPNPLEREAQERELAELDRHYRQLPQPHRHVQLVRAILDAGFWLVLVLFSIVTGAWSFLRQRALLRPAVVMLAVIFIAVMLWQPITAAAPPLLATLSELVVLLQLPSLPAIAAPPAEDIPPPAVSDIPPTPTPRGCAQVRVIAQRVNLRVAPGLRSEVLRKLVEGEILDVLNCAPVTKDGHQWLRVLAAQDVVPGWVAAELVAMDKQGWRTVVVAHGLAVAAKPNEYLSAQSMGGCQPARIQ